MMLNLNTLMDLIIEDSGDLKSFASKCGINYNSIYYSTRTPERFAKIPIQNFFKIAHALGMTADELLNKIEDDPDLFCKEVAL